MRFHLFRPTRRRPIIAALYGTIVAQARLPVFYRFFGVPDTVRGRLEMIMLHAVLLLRQLEQGALRDVGQVVFDRFCHDMDESLREMGVGDLAVPKQMRGIGQAFYGRQAAYGAALAVSNDELLAAALDRNLFAEGSGEAGGRRLAIYVREAVGQLADQDGFERGELTFPDPEVILRAQRSHGLEELQK